MMKWKSLLAMVCAAILFSGCVSQQGYDELKTAYRLAREQVVALQSQVKKLNQKIDRLKARGQSDSELVASLRAERDKLIQKLNKLESKYQTLASRANSGVILPPRVNQALKQFAGEYPQLVEYMPKRGMVKFKSDLTFPSGSAQVSAAARQSLQELAEVLNRPAVRKYEVRIVGHTDNVPIGKPSTRKKHPTNWHLSVDRAIAVRNVLAEAGVSSFRTTVQGWGKYRPIVPNSANGAQANRRVEIFLVNLPPANREYLPRISGSSSDAPTQASSTRPLPPMK